MDGKFPPLTVILGLGGAMILSITALLHPIVSALVIPALALLLVERIQTHQKARTERIAVWDRLRETFAGLVQFKADFTNSSQRYAETSQALLNTQFELRAVSQRYEEASATLTETQNKFTDLSERHAQLTERYNQIDPERRDCLAKEIEKQKRTLAVLGEIAELHSEEQRLEGVIANLKERMILFEEEALLQSFGFYKPLYDCADSQEYRRLLEQVRQKQKMMVKENKALSVTVAFALNNQTASGKKLAKNLPKLILRAFNGECDATIDKVTFSNLDAITKRLIKSQEELNEICEPMGVSITQAYLNAKIEELHVCYEYRMKLKDEKEEQRNIREQMREDAKVAKEIEEDRKKIQKDKRHFDQVITETRARMEAAPVAERGEYEKKLSEYEEQRAVVEQREAEVEFRAAQPRAGYVYVISNIGSFGHGVYKIGVSRREEPEERIDELGDASVPFGFDIHAMIFSADAMNLESELHRHFDDRRVNRVNPRKEFFQVTLSEVEEVVRKNHDAVVEFTKIAKAEDFRLSLAQDGKHAPVTADADGAGVAV